MEFGNDCCLLRCSGRHVGREERAKLALIVESLRAGGDEEEDEEEKEAVRMDELTSRKVEATIQTKTFSNFYYVFLVFFRSAKRVRAY